MDSCTEWAHGFRHKQWQRNISCYTTLSSKQKLSVDRYPACESPCLLLLAAFPPCVLVDREILAKLSDSQRFAIMEKDTGERRISVTSRLPEKCGWTRLCMSVYLFLPRAGRQCYPDVAIRDRFWRGKYLGLIPLHKSPLVFLLFSFIHTISTCLGRRILNQEHSFSFLIPISRHGGSKGLRVWSCSSSPSCPHASLRECPQGTQHQTGRRYHHRRGQTSSTTVWPQQIGRRRGYIPRQDSDPPGCQRNDAS